MMHIDENSHLLLAEFVPLPGYVLAGTGLSTIVSTTLEDCKDACATTAGCLGITFSGKNTCWYVRYHIQQYLQWS